MTATIERPPLDTPDAGVIEEARARQRRHRGVAAMTTVLAAGVAGSLLLLSGGGRGSNHESALAPKGRSPAGTARQSPTSCYSARKRELQGAPSKSLLSILGVLRRPATTADALPPRLIAAGAASDAFVHYIRRTRVVGGASYYIYPAILGGCGVHPREGMANLATNIDLGHGIIGSDGGGGITAVEIERGDSDGTGPPGSSTSATITMIVPDGVASVTLRYPAGRASGYSPKISPPFTVTTKPVNNELVVEVPRSAGGGPIWKPTMIWRAADGRVIKTFDRL